MWGDVFSVLATLLPQPCHDFVNKINEV